MIFLNGFIDLFYLEHFDKTLLALWKIYFQDPYFITSNAVCGGEIDKQQQQQQLVTTRSAFSKYKCTSSVDLLLSQHYSPQFSTIRSLILQWFYLIIYISLWNL